MIETEAVSPSDNTPSPAQQQQHSQQVNSRRKKGSGTSARSCSSSQNGADDIVTKALVADYVSDVSSEDFSGPEDGECESDGGGRNRAVVSPSEPRRIVNVVPPEPTVVRVASVPTLIENASPIEEDDDDDLGLSKNFFLINIKYCEESSTVSDSSSDSRYHELLGILITH